MQTHPALFQHAVDATLRAFRQNRVTYEEAQLDLTEMLASQINGKTDYAVAVIGYYVREILKAVSADKVEMPSVCDAFVEAAARASEGHCQASERLSQVLQGSR